MKCIALLHADLDTSPLGLRSRLADEIDDCTVLRRTVDRLSAVDRLARIVVMSPPGQIARVQTLLDGAAAVVEPDTAPPPPYRDLVRAGRMWGLDSWRGGIGGLCWFDEDVHPALDAAVAQRYGADAVAIVPAAAAMIEPHLVDAMLEYYERVSESYRLVFCQAPPGLSPAIISRSLLAEFAPVAHPPGTALVYRPDQPQPDLTGKEACFRPAAAIIEARGRLIADTRRSFERVAALIDAGGEEWSAEKIGAWISARDRTEPGTMPEEIELELTTEDALAGRTSLRPRGAEVGHRGPLELDVVDALVDGLGDDDDVRIILGGFGEPLLHPQFAEIVSRLRHSKALATAVRTSGLVGDAAMDDLLFLCPVDVIVVTLDATTAETYRRVHGVDGFQDAQQRVARWIDRRTASRQVRPLIVPEFLKTTENIAEMETFHDDWLRRLGTSVIAGPSDYGGRRRSLSVTRMTPPRRIPCRQLYRRATVLADGSLVACDQDYRATQPIGRIGDRSLGDLWSNGAAILREDHRRQVFDGRPLCAACSEWHRP